MFPHYRTLHKNWNATSTSWRIDTWDRIPRGIINEAIDQWQTRLHACVKAKGRHFEHLLWSRYTTDSCQSHLHTETKYEVFSFIRSWDKRSPKRKEEGYVILTTLLLTLNSPGGSTPECGVERGLLCLLCSFEWQTQRGVQWAVCMSALTDAQLDLGDRCTAGDLCADPAAQCRAGSCQCQDDFFIANNRCGRWINILLHLFISSVFVCAVRGGLESRFTLSTRVRLVN